MYTVVSEGGEMGCPLSSVWGGGVLSSVQGGEGRLGCPVSKVWGGGRGGV